MYYQSALRSVVPTLSFRQFTCNLVGRSLKKILFSVCQVVAGGITIIIDFTYSPWNELRDMTTTWNIPYYHVDISIGPSVAALSMYLQEKDAHDAALIFQSGAGKDTCSTSSAAWCLVKTFLNISVIHYTRKKSVVL